jgi:hypothetical protein
VRLNETQRHSYRFMLGDKEIAFIRTDYDDLTWKAYFTDGAKKDVNKSDFLTTQSNPMSGIDVAPGGITAMWATLAFLRNDANEPVTKAENEYLRVQARDLRRGFIEQQDELESLQRFHESTMKAVTAADEYVKEHKLGLGGEDIVILVIEDARRLRTELAKADQQNSQIAGTANTLCAESEMVHEQNRELQIRNAQLRAMLERVKAELANGEILPELHEAIEATLNQPSIDDLPF